MHFKDISEVKTELELLLKKMDETTRGTEGWRNVIARINELTNGTLDYIKATPEEVKKVTQAYIEQAKQLAINKRVVEKLAESELAAVTKRGVMETIVAEVQRRSEIFRKTGEVTQLSARAFGEIAAALEISDDNLDEFQKKLEIYTRPGMQAKNVKRFGKAAQYINDLIGSQYAILSENMKKYYEELLKPIPVNEVKKETEKALKSNFQLLDDMYEEWLQNRYKTIQDTFERETAMENDRFELQYRKYIYEYTKRLENLKTALKKGVVTQEQYDQHLLDLQEQMGVKVEENYSEQYQRDAAQFKKDLDNKLITEKQYERMMIELQIQHKDEMIITETSTNGIIQGLMQEHYDKLFDIEDKFSEEEIKKAQEIEATKLKLLEDYTERQLKIQKKRVKNTRDEIYNNKVVTQNINTYTDAVKKLKQELETIDIPDEGKTQKEIQDKIKKYTEKINKEIAKYSTSQQTKKIGSLWDIMGGGINFSEDFKKGVLQKMGIDTGLIQDQEIIDGLFQNWIDETEAAFGDWADKIKDTLSSLLDAWVEYYKAKAEAAAEDTEAAKEEYEKQKALLEAGYASSIEKEWAAYQEKKRIQKQAEKEAELWNERQRQLSQLETVASLGTAIANLFKSLTAGGAVGVAIAAAASAALLGAFTQARQQANSVVKYGAGHVETIQGGSHASGHDSPLAYDSQGRERRVEGGEMFAVINRKAVGRYGNGMIEDVINSINAMNYKGVDAVKVAMVGTDLSKIERNLDTLVGNSDGRVMMDADGNMIVKRNNFIKKISFQRTALS